MGDWDRLGDGILALLRAAFWLVVLLAALLFGGLIYFLIR